MKNILCFILPLFLVILLFNITSCCDSYAEPRDEKHYFFNESLGKSLEHLFGNDSEKNIPAAPKEKAVYGIVKNKNMPIIGIYSGEGSWSESVEALQNFMEHYDFQWLEFNSNDVSGDQIYTDVDMIIFPGGFAAEYRYAIKDHHKIRSFIENGGLFIGICAGAYYAASVFNWQKQAYDYPLNLFPGAAIGPLTGLHNWGDLAPLILSQDCKANADFDAEIGIYYYDGPYFKADSEDSIKVVASYSLNEEAAVIAGSLGTGHYLLLGPHPELGHFDPERSGPDTHGNKGAQWPWLYAILLWLNNLA